MINLKLIQGEFSASDALDLITQMLHVKIKYHENKILTNSSEEDIKQRELKIRLLQKQLAELRENIYLNGNKVNLNGTIEIE